MIEYVIICKEYKKGNQCAKHISRTLHPRYAKGDVLLLRLKDGIEKCTKHSIPPNAKVLITNDVAYCEMIKARDIEQFVEVCKRKNVTR